MSCSKTLEVLKRADNGIEDFALAASPSSVWPPLTNGESCFVPAMFP